MTTNSTNTTPLAVALRDVVIRHLGKPVPGSATTELDAAVARLVGKVHEIYAFKDFVDQENREWQSLKAVK